MVAIKDHVLHRSCACRPKASRPGLALFGEHQQGLAPGWQPVTSQWPTAQRVGLCHTAAAQWLDQLNHLGPKVVQTVTCTSSAVLCTLHKQTTNYIANWQLSYTKPAHCKQIACMSTANAVLKTEALGRPCPRLILMGCPADRSCLAVPAIVRHWKT